MGIRNQVKHENSSEYWLKKVFQSFLKKEISHKKNIE